MTIDDAAFFALACSCLCVSLHLMNDDTLLQMGYSERMREMAIAEWNQLMLDTMHVADWGGNHRIEWIQAYLYDHAAYFFAIILADHCVLG